METLPGTVIFRARIAGELLTPDGGREVNCSLRIFLVEGRTTWFVDGEPILESTDAAFIGRTQWVLDRYAGVPVSARPEVENVFECFDPLRG